MVEGQAVATDPLDRSQVSRNGIPAALQSGQARGDREVRDGDNAHTGVATGCAIATELLEVPVIVWPQAGLLGQFAGRGLIEILAATDEPARKSPFSEERLLPAAHESHVERAIPDGEDRDIDGHGERLKLARTVTEGSVTKHGNNHKACKNLIEYTSR